MSLSGIGRLLLKTHFALNGLPTSINADNPVRNVNLKFVYTLYHIVVSQTTLPALEASVGVSVNINMYNTLAFYLSKPPWFKCSSYIS